MDSLPDIRIYMSRKAKEARVHKVPERRATRKENSVHLKVVSLEYPVEY